MPFDTLIALAVFALVAAITPGPNNMMVMSSGVNFGFARTVPHMFGIAGGFCLLVFSMAMGIGTLLTEFPELHIGLKVVGASYLLYLAWKIANTTKLQATDVEAVKPLTVLQAAVFQWLNPKGWMMGLTAVALFGNQNSPMTSGLIISAVFVLATVPAVTIWTGFGMLLRQFLSDPVRLQWFNRAMGLALALTVIPMVT